MFILQTNDDGIRAPGLLALHRALKPLFPDIAVVAPDQVQSATGHGITLSSPLLTDTVTIENGFTGTSVDGRPADCVKLAIDQLLLDRARLEGGQVLSINLPALHAGEIPKGIKICRQCTHPWPDTYDRRKDPRGRAYFWNSSVFSLGTTDDDTDVAAIRDKYIAVTPLHFDLTNHSLLKDLQVTDWPLPKA
jgi:broad specificity polyphosphatase/5'/3'-nucleotidase SurE